MSSKHRIGFDLDRPTKIMGLTKDEFALLIFGLACFMFSPNKLLGICLMGACGVLLMVVKRFKKRIGGFNLKAFMWWYFGFEHGHPTLPPSHIRKWNK